MFNHRSHLRIAIVEFTESKNFENFIVLLIILSTLTMLITDPADPDNLSEYNQTLEKLNIAFLALFVLESVLKVITQGLIMHENAYLRDSWNWIDCLVVITGLLELLNLNGANLKSLRALRVLRPLRSIKAFPSMRKLIQGMINSLPSLINAVIFMGFILLNFAIFGTQQFGGLYYSRCRLTQEPANDTWPYDPSD